MIEALCADGITTPATIRIDGGMATNDWFAQFLTWPRCWWSARQTMKPPRLMLLIIGIWPDLAALDNLLRKTATSRPAAHPGTEQLARRTAPAADRTCPRSR